MRRILIGTLFLLSACSAIGDGMRKTASSVNKLRTDALVSYNELKFYRPQADPNPQPQLRYCYQFISDIVCYDAPQPNIRSRLVAAQEGVPGRIMAGTSSSTYEPIYAEAAPTDPILTAPSYDIQRPLATEATVEQNGIQPPPVTQEGKCTGDSPFPCKESGYVPGVDVGK